MCSGEIEVGLFLFRWGFRFRGRCGLLRCRNRRFVILLRLLVLLLLIRHNTLSLLLQVLRIRRKDTISMLLIIVILQILATQVLQIARLVVIVEQLVLVVDRLDGRIVARIKAVWRAAILLEGARAQAHLGEPVLGRVATAQAQRVRVQAIVRVVGVVRIVDVREEVVHLDLEHVYARVADVAAHLGRSRVAVELAEQVIRRVVVEVVG